MTYEPDVFARRRVDGPICELVMAIRWATCSVRVLPADVEGSPPAPLREPTVQPLNPAPERAVGTKLGDAAREDRPCIRVIREPVHVVAAAESVARRQPPALHHVRPRRSRVGSYGN